jgi:hypothetical protein
MDIISESELQFSDELSESMFIVYRSVCLGCLASLVGLLISISLSFFVLLVLLRLGFEPEGPQMSRILLNPWGSKFMTLGFTIMIAAGYSPTLRVPER